MIAAASTRPSLSPTAVGVGLTLASAVLLSTLGVTTQLAYDAGAPVGTLLVGRFLVAAPLLWLLVLVLRSRRPSRRQAVAGLALGAGFSAHAALFSASLARLDAGLVDLLVFTYPALVMVGAVALRRERWSTRRALALGAMTAGTSLVLVGGLNGIDPIGAVLAVGAAVAYAAYILISAGQLERTDPLFLTALVTTGAAIVLTFGGIAGGGVSLDLGASAYGLIAAVGLVAVAGMGTFVAGIGRLGASRASIVSAVQPALTPVLGFAVFSDRLGPAQMAGGALVIASVVALEAGALTGEGRSWLAWLPRRERRRTRPGRERAERAGRQAADAAGSAGVRLLPDRGRARGRPSERPSRRGARTRRLLRRDRAPARRQPIGVRRRFDRHADPGRPAPRVRPCDARAPDARARGERRDPRAGHPPTRPGRCRLSSRTERRTTVYPHVTQLETRRREVESAMQLERERRASWRPTYVRVRHRAFVTPVLVGAVFAASLALSAAGWIA